MEKVPVKEYMIKWAIGYNIQMNQWGNIWSKWLKFTL